MIRAFVGLGNPGKKYSETRHNIGFAVCRELSGRCPDIKESKAKKFLLGEGRLGGTTLLFVYPGTYMNESGSAVLSLMTSRRIALSEIIVVHDDIHIPFGMIRMKRGGGTGGHNGISSVIRTVGPDFARLKIGVGSDFPDGRQSEYVLGKFKKKERETLPLLLETAADALLECASGGLDGAMEKYNNRNVL